MGIPDHLTCLLRNLYAGQEATVRTGCGTTDWFKIELSDSTTTNSLKANLRRSKLTNLHKYVIAWCPWRVIRLKWLFIIPWIAESHQTVIMKEFDCFAAQQDLCFEIFFFLI